MIPHFKDLPRIHTDKHTFDIKQASMIVQEKEPLFGEGEIRTIDADAVARSSPSRARGCR